MVETASNVVRISDFRKAANTDNATIETISIGAVGHAFSRVSDGSAGVSQDYTDVGSLYDEAANTKLSGFLRLLDEAIVHLKKCSDSLDIGEGLIADTEFMEAHRLLSELFMLRDLNDSVGLVVLRAIEACEGVVAITEHLKLPQEIAAVLATLYHRPFMSFENALDLVEPLKSSDGRDLPRVGGLEELIDLLIQGEVKE
jgi:hypothetical protein